MKEYKLYFFVFAVVLILLSVFSCEVSAQCAMCRAVPVSNQAGGGKVGLGLNTGIMYLIIIPYLLLTVGAYLFFKKAIDAKIKKFLNRNS